MIKVFEAFAGVGTQRMALKNQGIEHEVTAISEVDEYALLSYHAVHTSDKKVEEASEEEMQRYMEEKNIPLDPKGKRKTLKNKRLKDLYVASVASNNLGDISKVTGNEIPRVDLFTYSFPCQDISNAGERKGLDRNSGTRSSLLWECERIIETVKPKYLLMENVKALVNKNNRPQFDIWLEYLEKQGYKNFWQVLNAKDYGIPQSRERVFVVSILDENADYKFPKPKKLEKRLRDVLEDEVDETFYLDNEKTNQLIATITDENDITEKTVVDASINEPKTKEVMNTITARYDAGIQNHKSVGGVVIEPTIIQIGNTTPNPKRENPQTGRTYDVDGLAPTLNTMQGGNRQPQIIEPKVAASRGRNPENSSDRAKGVPTEQRLEVNEEGISNTLTTVQKDNYVVEPLGTLASEGAPNFKIRKLTPNEAWRLMGITDEEHEKASKVVSNTQLYKQAGNAIVVDVLEGIFKQLFDPDANNQDG